MRISEMQHMMLTLILLFTCSHTQSTVERESASVYLCVAVTQGLEQM